MPTYTVSVKHGLLSHEQKENIMKYITLAHTKATRAANYFV